MKINFFRNLVKLALTALIFLGSNAFAKYELAVECKDTVKGNYFSAMDIYPNNSHVFQFQGTHRDLPAGNQNFKIFNKYPEKIKTRLNQISPSMAELDFYNQNNEHAALLLDDNTSFGRVKNLVILNIAPEIPMTLHWPKPVKVNLTIESQNGAEGDKVLEFERCRLLLPAPRDSWEAAFGVDHN